MQPFQHFFSSISEVTEPFDVPSLSQVCFNLSVVVMGIMFPVLDRAQGTNTYGSSSRRHATKASSRWLIEVSQAREPFRQMGC